MQVTTSKTREKISRVRSNNESLPEPSSHDLQVTENEDDAEWEGFDTQDNDGAVESDHTSLEPGLPLKKTPRKPKPAIRRNNSFLQRKGSSLSADEEETSSKLLENAMKDEADGIGATILFIEVNH